MKQSLPLTTDGHEAGTSDDVKLLQSMGYAQELHRRMSGFSNFAISFSIICILAGGITSLQLGLSAVGGAAAGVVWPAGVVFCLMVALCMAQIASVFPTAGGLYQWSSILGGRGWGWAAAWFNLGGLIFVTAAVNVGTYQLFVNFIGPLLGVNTAKLTLAHQVIGVTLIIGTQALLNHFGIRVTTLLTDFSGYLILLVASVLTLAMLFAASAHEITRLFTFTNFSGESGGGRPTHPKKPFRRRATCLGAFCVRSICRDCSVGSWSAPLSWLCRTSARRFAMEKMFLPGSWPVCCPESSARSSGSASSWQITFAAWHASPPPRG